MYKITIHKGKEKQAQKHHPWVFSGAIDTVEPKFKNSDWAEVYTSDNSFIAYGWYDERSHIILHLLSWNKKERMDNNFVKALVKRSVLRRRELLSMPDTTAFRLIHGEADFIPGFTLDCYGTELRGIVSSRFAEHFLQDIIDELENLLSPSAIQITVDPQYAKAEDLKQNVRFFMKGKESNDTERKNIQFMEKGIYYEVEPGKGQKSGFYCDQRDNRQIVEDYAKDKKVLDVCSYTGGFTLHALKAGATSVDAIDGSESALRHLLYQIHINQDKGVLKQGSREKVSIREADAFDYIRLIEENYYDLMILDPPKLAKTKGQLENAQKAYKDLNRVAMTKIKNGGIIFTFSCSGAMTRENFKLTLAWAAADAGVEIQILRTLSAGEDHPIRLSFPESEYLKGYVIKVIKPNSYR